MFLQWWKQRYNFWIDSHMYYFSFFSGLMITSGSIHYVLSLLNITTNIRDVCVFLAPLFSGFTAIATYLLTKELWSQGAGLFAAGFICIVPGYISRYVKTRDSYSQLHNLWKSFSKVAPVHFVNLNLGNGVIRKFDITIIYLSLEQISLEKKLFLENVLH